MTEHSSGVTANRFFNIREILRGFWTNSGIVIVYIVLFILFSLFIPYFFTLRNMIALGLSVSMVSMVACTMLFCLASGDFDLSVESIVAFSGVLAAVVINMSGNVFLGVFLWNSWWGSYRVDEWVDHRKNSYQRSYYHSCNGADGPWIYFHRMRGSGKNYWKREFFCLGNGNFFGIPNPILISILCFGVFGILINKTTYGKDSLAIGGNIEAARLAGINVDRIKIIIFLVQGLMAGFAGVVLASRMTSGQPNAALGFSLDVISACVLGGVSLKGGIAPIKGVIVGVLIMGTVQDAMNLMNIPTFYQYIARGGILLIAVTIDQIRQERLRKSI